MDRQNVLQIFHFTIVDVLAVPEFFLNVVFCKQHLNGKHFHRVDFLAVPFVV